MLPFWAEPVVVGESPEAPPNVLVLLLDTLRADRLGCYGWERAHTPHLDALAGRGVRFDQAIAGAPWTLPSHATLFTSNYVSEHGLWADDHRLPDSFVTLAENLRDHGYRTLAVSEGGFVRPSYGLAQGFDSFQVEHKDVAKTFARALDRIDLAASDGAPYFAFVQTYQVHSPYDPPSGHREELVREYEGSLPEAVNPARHAWGAQSREHPRGGGRALPPGPLRRGDRLPRRASR